MKLKICTFILTLMFPITLQAQTSIVDALPDIPDGESNGWSGGTSGSISWRDDNNKDNNFSASMGGFVYYEGDGWSAILSNKAAYEWLNDSEQEASVMSHTRLRLSLGRLSRISRVPYKPSFLDQLFLETFAQHEYDRFRALDARTLLGAGATVVIVKNDMISIMAGTAYMLEYIDFTNTNDELNHRWSNYLQVEFVPVEALTVESTTFAQFRFDDFTDHVVSSSLSLKVKALDWFGVKLGFGLAYDSRPPPDVKDLGINVSSEIFAEF